MTFPPVLTSLFASIRRAFESQHTWVHDHHMGVRACTVCGRKEELWVELVSTEWAVIEPGAPSAHAVKAGDRQSPLPTGPVLAREESPSSQAGSPGTLAS